MSQPFLHNMYVRHERLVKKLLSMFIWSYSAREKMKMMLAYPNGIREFRKKTRELTTADKKPQKFKHFISIVAIVRDEALNFPEWIEYHKIIGIDKFYIYDNESTDNTREILQPYIDAGIVEYIYFPGEKMQTVAYNHFLTHFKNETQWATTIDLDEFIVSKQEPFVSFLRKQNPNIAQILVPWVFFGSNGHIKRPAGLVIENYTKRAARPRMHKSIFNPRLTLCCNVHKHIVVGKTINPNMNDIMINHYFCKSWQDFEKRASRGDAYRGHEFAAKTFNRAKFDQHDKNDVYDPFILQYVDRVKKNLNK